MDYTWNLFFFFEEEELSKHVENQVRDGMEFMVMVTYNNKFQCK